MAKDKFSKEKDESVIEKFINKLNEKREAQQIRKAEKEKEDQKVFRIFSI
jgi:hypothetical protein